MADRSATAHDAADPSIDPSERPANPALDSVLIRQVIAGSQDALARLYDRHAGAVYGVARRTSGDPSIASEVVQETFLALWNRAESFDPAKGALSSWLLTIARNRAIDRLRFATRHDKATTFSSFEPADADDESTADWLTASGELIGAAGPEPGPEAAFANIETRAMLDAALATLSPAERRVISLAYDVGLSQSQIAAAEHWPIGTVKTRTRRALRTLREQLESTGDGSPAAPVLAKPSEPSPCVAPC
jgi:RNA polymerase sigma-70 factor (ECF subfamily)